MFYALTHLMSMDIQDLCVSIHYTLYIYYNYYIQIELEDRKFLTMCDL